MHPDEDSQTTLSKWPFILGDISLVASALAIAILGNWQLTDWQVGACVAAVALGAALFVLPYIVEFEVRVREEHEDRAAELRILEKHLQAAEQTLSTVHNRLRALENSTADANQHNTALAEIAEQKLPRLEAARASQEEVIHALQKNLEELSQEAPTAFVPEMLKPIEERVEALEKRPAAPTQSNETTSPENTSDAAAPPPEEKAPIAPMQPTNAVAPIEHPKRSARERRGPQEFRLLQRAISEKGNKSSTAVGRIIESKVKEQKKPEPSAAEGLDMLLDEAEVSSPLPRAKAKKNDAVLTAAVFIGIGNKPYLRGSGGGLSWEKGVAMEFQEIGKWQWVAPADLEASLEVEIRRNDEDPDTSGRYTLEPGQKLEVTPVF